MEKIFAGIGKGISVCILLMVITACAGSKKMNVNLYNQEKILQLIFDSSDVSQYFHPEAEGRIPIKIATNGHISNNVNLNKYGEKVTVVTTSSSEETLDVHLFSIQGNNATFEIRYGIEGVTIEGTAVLSESVWELKSLEVSES